MTYKKTYKIVTAALMAALTCLATMVIQVPSPTGGYIHLGDGFVLLSGIILGPIYGGAAAGIGSMLADLISGYGEYAPATLIIKAFAAILGSITYYTLSHTIFHSKPKYIPIVSAGVVSGIIVTAGYLLFESLLLGNGFVAAVVGVPANLVQNLFGIIVSTILLPLLSNVPVVKEALN